MNRISDTLSKDVIINGQNVHIRPIIKNDVANEKFSLCAYYQKDDTFHMRQLVKDLGKRLRHEPSA